MATRSSRVPGGATAVATATKAAHVSATEATARRRRRPDGGSGSETDEEEEAVFEAAAVRAGAAAIPQTGSDDEFGDENDADDDDDDEEDAPGSDGEGEEDEDGDEEPRAGEFKAVASDPAATASEKKKVKSRENAKRDAAQHPSNKDAALAKAFSKIMGAHHAKTGASAVLAASKSVLKRAREDDDASAKAASARKARAELLKKRGHAPVPARGEDPEHDAREKALSKIATRGVVALFNAVSTAQRKAREAEAAGAKAATATAAGKAGFLSALRGSAVAAAVAPHAAGGRSSNAAPPSAKGWDVLNPNYDTLAGGKKMKDWDRRREEDESAKGAGPVGDALSSDDDDDDEKEDGDGRDSSSGDEGGRSSSSDDDDDDDGGGGGLFLSQGDTRMYCAASKSVAFFSGTRGNARSEAVVAAPRAIGSSASSSLASSPLSPEATPSTSNPPPPPLRQRLTAAAAAAAFSLPLLTIASAPLALAAATISPSDVVVDTARLIPDGREPALAARIRALESSSSGGSKGGDGKSGSFRVRLATRFRDDPAAPVDDDLRKAWRPDPSTVVVLADPSAPNMLRILPGEATGAKLSRGFYLELAARYGNLFVRREDGGDGAALENAMDALLTCLESPTGCKVVPGLPDDQRNLTTVFAAAAGFVAGFASRVRPSGFVSWRFGWLVVFSPLWGSLLINFGLAPILVRTDDKLPILINLAVFAAGVALFRASPLFAGEPGRDRAVLTKEGQRKMRESESDNSDGD